MKKYMVTINLPARPNEELASLIPEQRRIANKLMHLGVIASYCLSADRLSLWVVLTADSVKEAMEILTQFPIINYVSVEIDELLFHQNGVFNIPQMSLN